MMELLLSIAAIVAAVFAAPGISERAPLPVINANNTIATTYVVKAGDTIAALATKLNVGICDLARFNALADPSVIYVGEQLIVPAAPYLPDDLSCLNINDTTTNSTCIYGGPHTYSTVLGDTIQKIANVRFGITVESITQYHGQTDYISSNETGIYDLLETGMNVKIPLCPNSQCIIKTFNMYYGTYQDLATVYGATTGQLFAINYGYNHSTGGGPPGPELTIPVNCGSQ